MVNNELKMKKWLLLLALSRYPVATEQPEVVPFY